MALALEQRPQWGVDRRLDDLIGQDLRVAAKSLAPASSDGNASLRFIPVRDLYLPDNRQPAGRPVFVEGRLQAYERQISVVVVRLAAPAWVADSPEGTVFFRGKAAVILRGPAVLELAFPFHAVVRPGPHVLPPVRVRERTAALPQVVAP